jgi:cystathionine beta-lyase/cystathionine gamma-synthase
MDDISFIINELGEDREHYYNAVTPPIIQSSNFCFPTVDEMRQSLKRESEVPFYTRGVNPTVEILRKKMAALEGTEDALIFASGSAAVAAAVMCNLSAGEHVICVQKPYSWTNKLLNVLLKRYGVQTTMVDGREAANFEAAMQPNTKLIIIESPNSFTFELQDIKAVVAIAKKHGCLTLLDNSYASPLFQQAAAWGVDLIVHSATKYISGHSDAVAGVVCGSSEQMQKIFASEFMTLGGIISPFNAWLLLRGLRTLPIRMQRVSSTTAEVVAFLEQHPNVEKVLYPFSPSHPQYELAKRQMKQGAGQFSLQIKADNMAQVEKFCNGLRRFLMACSWGGYESLIFPACTLYESANYSTSESPFNLIRFYIGLEEPEVLISDLQQALDGYAQ